MDAGRWSAELTHQEGAASPDYGRLPAPARTGVVAVGAVSWVTNLNVPLAGGEASLTCFTASFMVGKV